MVDMQLLKLVQERKGNFGVEGQNREDFETFAHIVRDLERLEAAGASRITAKMPNGMNGHSRWYALRGEVGGRAPCAH